MFYETLFQKLTFARKGQVKRRRSDDCKQRRRDAARLGLELLEERQLLSVSPWLASAAAHTSGHAASTPTVTLQDRPSTSYYGQPVLLLATVSGATGGSVEFFDGAAEIGAAVNVSSSGYADYVTDSLAVGTHSITAEYFATGASSATGTSTAVPETINAAPTRTAVVAPSNPLVAGNNVSFTATVSSAISYAVSNGQASADRDCNLHGD